MVNDYINKIRENPVKVGQTFETYKALCEYIGIPVTTGKQRILDQRHLQCYFRWEKKEGSNQLVITETYYDHPKPFEDRRIGIHTTELGEMLQNILLTTELDRGAYSISGLLYRMGLFTKSQSEIRTRLGKVEQTYSSRVCGRLRSAITQVQKRNLANIPMMVVDLNAGKPLPNEIWEPFRQIKRETLQEFGVQSEGKLWWSRRYQEYAKRLSQRTGKELGYSMVNERYYISHWTIHQEIIPPTKEDFLMIFGQDMLDSYQGGLGIASKNSYRADLLNLFSKLTKKPIELYL